MGRQLATQRRAVDQEAATYRANAERLSADDELLAEKIEYGLSELGRIGEQRQAIDGARIVAAELAVGPSIELHEEEGEEELEHATEEGHGRLDTPGKALDQYNDTISDLLDINGEIAPRSNNAELLKGVAASVALARAKDFADSQRSLLENVYAANHFQGHEYARLSALVAAETVYTAQFDASATEAQHEFLEETVAGPEVDTVDRFVERALDSERDRAQARHQAAAWFEAMSVKLDRMRVVEERLSADVIATSSAVKQGADRRAWLYSPLLAAALVLAVALALITARSLIRPCAGWRRRPRRRPGAGCPGRAAAPGRRAGRPGGRVGPADRGPLQRRDRPPGRGVQLRAPGGGPGRRPRSGPAPQRRRHVPQPGPAQPEPDRAPAGGDRRAGGQRLRGRGPGRAGRARPPGHQDAAQRREPDHPVRPEPARRWRGPISLTEVVQASVEEVKEHTRVELLPLGQVEVAGHAAADVMHLLAELIENAVTFSAPGTKALVAGQPGRLRVPAGDRGPGPGHERRAAGQGQPAPGHAAGHRLRPGQDARLLRGHPAGLQARHQGPAAALLARGITALVLLPRQLIVTSTQLAPVDDRAGRGEPGPAGRWRPPTPTWTGSTPAADGARALAPAERLPGRPGAGRADQLAANSRAGRMAQDQEGVGVEAGLAVGRAQAQVLGRHVEAVGHGLGDAASGFRQRRSRFQ